jgi:hypothetical protein
MNLKDLKEKLEAGYVSVQFTKKDGSERIGLFTTKSNLLAKTSGTSTRTKSENLIVATELSKAGPQWRSFNYDQVTEYTPEASTYN